jgi:hypothetical protein
MYGVCTEDCHYPRRGVTATIRSMPSSRILACEYGYDNSFHVVSHVWFLY